LARRRKRISRCYGIRRAHDEDETFTRRVGDIRDDLTRRLPTAGDAFQITIEGQALDNRGIAGELLLRRAEKLKGRGDDYRVGEFAGFDLYIRTGVFEGAELLIRGKGAYSIKFTDTALGTIRSLEHTVQTLDQRLTDCEKHLADAKKQGTELATKVGQPFEHEERLAELARRQEGIIKKLDLTKNQAASQMDTDVSENQAITETQTIGDEPNVKRRAGIRV